MKKVFLAGILFITLLTHVKCAENMSDIEIDISLSEDKSSFIIFVANTGRQNTWIITHTLFKDFIFQLSNNKMKWTSLEKAKKLKFSISGIIIFIAPGDAAVISIPIYKIQDMLKMKLVAGRHYSLSVLHQPTRKTSRKIEFSLRTEDIGAINKLQEQRDWWKTDTIKLNKKIDYSQGILQLR